MTTGKRLHSKIKPYADMMHGIAHPFRLAIAFSLAKEGELPVRQIIELVKVSPALVSHHLVIMRKTGWVKKMRIGKKVTYTFEPRNLKEIVRLLQGVALQA